MVYLNWTIYLRVFILEMKKCENSKKFLLNPDCTYRRIPHKADCTQERNLFISTKHPLTPFVKTS